ncbi:MAG: type II toxin-antitoxin system VapC family toxin [Acidobacteriota bacterium]
MWHLYFDASALVKRYSQEPGASLVDEAFSLIPAEQMMISALGILEVASILRRMRNDGRLPVALYKQVVAEFNNEVIMSGRFLTPEINNQIALSALSLISKHNLNASDVIILRSAINTQNALRQQGDDLMLWTSDKRLVRAAIAEVLTVFNPESDSIARLQQLL